MIMNCRLIALLMLQNGSDGFIKDLRPKIDIKIVIKTLRFMHAVYIYRKL